MVGPLLHPTFEQVLISNIDLHATRCVYRESFGASDETKFRCPENAGSCHKVGLRQNRRKTTTGLYWLNYILALRLVGRQHLCSSKRHSARLVLLSHLKISFTNQWILPALLQFVNSCIYRRACLFEAPVKVSRKVCVPPTSLGIVTWPHSKAFCATHISLVVFIFTEGIIYLLLFFISSHNLSSGFFQISMVHSHCNDNR